MRNNAHKPIALLAVACLLCVPVLAIEESEVQTAIAASSREQVAGNLFIWFLCAIAFLKIGQKIDSFMAGLGINVGRTGGSMVSELLIAGRALGIAARGAGGGLANIITRSSSRASNTVNHAGAPFPSGGRNVLRSVHNAAGNAAAASATGTGSGLSNVIAGAVLNSSMKGGGKFATEVVGAVATGNIATVGSITGPRAAEALTTYLGYSSSGQSPKQAVGRSPVAGAGVSPVSPNHGAPVSEFEGPSTGSEDTITIDGGIAAGAVDIPQRAAGAPAVENRQAAGVPTSKAPTFRDVEIGGGRITGYETPAEGGAEHQFAMYNASQYMEPVGQFEKVETADGQSWYKQVAQPVVQKTPYEDGPGKIKFHEQIVEQLPQIPKRKDRV